MKGAGVTDLLNAMSKHLGADKGASADGLATELRCSPRQLRRLISAAREQGAAICGHPGTGYYMPTTAEELDRGCEFLKARALGSLRLLCQMKRISMPVLAGQLNLNQG
jgi:biotin operon repressor